MPTVQQAISRKHAPSVLIQRTQIFGFDLSYYTAPLETVYENLWEKLRYNHQADAPKNARLVMSTWADPKEKGDEWFVADKPPEADPASTVRYAWNGKELVPKILTQEMIDHLRKHGFLI